LHEPVAPVPVVEASPAPLKDQQENIASPPHDAVFEASPVPLTAVHERTTIVPQPLPPTVFEAFPPPLTATQLTSTPRVHPLPKLFEALPVPLAARQRPERAHPVVEELVASPVPLAELHTSPVPEQFVDVASPSPLAANPPPVLFASPLPLSATS
jgi:hypothetical protein